MVTNVNLNNIDPVNDNDDKYQGGINPSYIPSNDADLINETPDTSSVSSPETSASTGTKSSPLKSGDTNSKVDKNYIENDSSRDDELFNQTKNAEDRINEALLNFNEDSFYEQDENGYWVINQKLFDALYRRLLGLCNMRLTIAMMQDERGEVNNMIFESVTGLELDLGNKTSLTETTAKSNQKIIKEIQRGVSTLTKKIQEHNSKVYTEALKKAKEAEGDDWTNFWNGDADKQKSLEMQRDAREQFIAAMNDSIKTLNKISNGSFKGLTPETEKQGNDIINRLQDYRNYLKFDENGYIDTSWSKQFIVDLRKEFVSVLNVNRTIVSLAKQKESAQKIIWESIQGKALGSNKLGSVEEAFGAESAYQTTLFDQTSSQILQVQKLSNEIKYLKLQIKKLEESRWASVFSKIFKALAIIAAAVATVALSICTFGIGGVAVVSVAGVVLGAATAAGAVAGIASAAFAYGAAAIANSIKDNFNPTISTFIHNTSNSSKIKKGIFAKSKELQEQEEILLESIGSAQVDTLGDGNKAVNNQKLAILNNRLNGIYNAQRFLAKAINLTSSIQRRILRSIIGISGGSDGNSMLSSLDDILKTNSMQFQAYSSNLKEYKEAFNIELQQERAMEEAAMQFIVGIIVGGVGAILGAFGGVVGSLAGFAIGQAVGSASADFYNAGRYGTKDIEYNPEFITEEKVEQSKGLLSSLDGAIEGIYSELFSEGICDSGDGNIAINTDKAAALQKRLERIFVTVANINAIYEEKSAVMNAIWQSLGVAVESQSTKDILKSNFDSAINKFKQSVGMLSEHVQVHNRANAAQQRYANAAIKLGISIGGAAVSIVGLGFGLEQISNLAMGITSLTQSTIDFIDSMLRARDDFGQLKNSIEIKDANDLKPQSIINQKDIIPEWKILEAAEELENRVQNSVSQKMIEEIGGGEWGINSGLFEETSTKLEQIGRVREMLNENLSLMKEIKAKLARLFGGIVVNSSGQMEMVTYISQAISQSILQNQMQALEQYISRHNQLNTATKRAVVAGIQTGISLVQTVLSTVSYGKTNKIEKTVDKLQKAKELTKNSQIKLTPAQIREYTWAQAFKQNLSYINLALTSVRFITEMLTVGLYDKQESKIDRTRGKKPDKNQEKNSKAVVSKELSLLSFGEKVNQLEIETNNIAIQKGIIELDTQLLEILKNLEKELGRYAESAIKAITDSVKGTFGNAKKPQTNKIGAKFEKLELPIPAKPKVQALTKEELNKTLSWAKTVNDGKLTIDDKGNIYNLSGIKNVAVLKSMIIQALASPNVTPEQKAKLESALGRLNQAETKPKTPASSRPAAGTKVSSNNTKEEALKLAVGLLEQGSIKLQHCGEVMQSNAFKLKMLQNKEKTFA